MENEETQNAESTDIAVRKKYLDKDDYFKQETELEYMSASQFKDFRKCEAMAMAKINGTYKRHKTISMLIGSYIYFLVLSFKVVNKYFVIANFINYQICLLEIAF